MPGLKIQGFGGVVPRMSPTLLKENDAQEAQNVKLYSGELRYWRGVKKVFEPKISDVYSIYRLRKGELYRWLTWTTDVDVVSGPIADLDEVRIYYTGDGAPKKTNWALASTGVGPYPAAYQAMGVPFPTNALTAVASTGTGTVETRVYCYTYINEFGSVVEEGAPSLASNKVNAYPNGTVTLTGFVNPVAPNNNITKIRIYRLASGTQGASYQFVDEVPVTTTTYTDSKTGDQLGETLSSTDYLPPPDDLKGIVSMANGILAGFVGNTIYFCEPFLPHAWPRKYALTVDVNIVGLGAFGSSLAVMTEMFPYVVTGTSPSAMTSEKQPLPEPCVSKRSIAGDKDSIVYASPNGLVAIGPSVRGVTTTSLFRREDWQLYQPQLIVGAFYDSKYFGFFQSPTYGSRCMVLSRDDFPAMSYFNANGIAVHADIRNAALHYLSFQDNNIYQVDVDELSPIPYEWKSKRFLLPAATSFSAVKIDADFDEIQNEQIYNEYVKAIEDANKALFAANSNLKGALNHNMVNEFVLDGSILQDLPRFGDVRSVTLFVYADGALVFTTPVYTADPIRLPPFKARAVEVKLSGNVNVRSIKLATTVPELRGL